MIQNSSKVILSHNSWNAARISSGPYRDSPSVFLWNLRIFKSCTDWCLTSRVDGEFCESSGDVIHWQLDAHCGTSNCSCAQKKLSLLSGGKTASSHWAMMEAYSKRNILGVFMPLWRTFRAFNYRIVKNIAIITFCLKFSVWALESFFT
jgi:hypothetical protein